VESSRLRRRFGRPAAVVAAAALALGGTLAFAAPANAATTDVDDATLTWGVNGYAQKGIFGPWVFKDLTGNTTYLPGATQTEYVTAAFPATSFPANAASGPNPNAIKFSEGTGTVDPATGAGELSWDGSYTINAYPAQYNAPNEIYSDPQLSVAADGSGELSFDFSIGAGISMSGEPFEAVQFGRLTLAEFSTGSISGLDGDSLRLTPDFAGVVLDPAIVTNQVTSCAPPAHPAGAWPAEFVETLQGHPAGASVSPHFYSSGCGGMQDSKPALPIDVAYTVTAEEPETPTADANDVVVEVPEWVDEETGAFGWAFAGTSPANLGVAAQSGSNFAASGSLTDIVVTDTRSGGSAGYEWTISGQAGDFTSAAGTFTGGYLGWAPKIVAGGSSVTAGAAVTSTHTGGTGLGSSRVLASSTAAGGATVGADLSLVIPGTTAAGDYTSTLTITALSE
jgi:hypothetical protein